MEWSAYVYPNFGYSTILIFYQLTNEFNFSIAAFHHAHESYLVPDLLKKAYGMPLFLLSINLSEYV